MAEGQQYENQQVLISHKFAESGNSTLVNVNNFLQIKENCMKQSTLREKESTAVVVCDTNDVACI